MLPESTIGHVQLGAFWLALPASGNSEKDPHAGRGPVTGLYAANADLRQPQVLSTIAYLIPARDMILFGQ